MKFGMLGLTIRVFIYKIWQAVAVDILNPLLRVQ